MFHWTHKSAIVSLKESFIVAFVLVWEQWIHSFCFETVTKTTWDLGRGVETPQWPRQCCLVPCPRLYSELYVYVFSLCLSLSLRLSFPNQINDYGNLKTSRYALSDTHKYKLNINWKRKVNFFYRISHGQLKKTHFFIKPSYLDSFDVFFLYTDEIECDESCLCKCSRGGLSPAMWDIWNIFWGSPGFHGFYLWHVNIDNDLNTTHFTTHTLLVPSYLARQM